MIFEVPLKDDRVVYMKTTYDHSMPPTLNVVLVSAARLYQICGNEQLRKKNPGYWLQDSKFAEIEKAFANSRRYPVPLPIVGNPEHPKDGLLHFDDGITRTMWLFTYGAKHFPVYCSPTCSDRLKELAGV